MALPAEISTVLMTGTVVDDTGAPLFGTITLTPSVEQLVSASTDRLIQLRPHSLLLDVNGSFAIPLIPSNELDVFPHGVTWTLRLPDGRASLTFTVPSDVLTADISAHIVALADTGDDEPEYLIGFRGPQGIPGVPGPAGPAGYDDAAIQARLLALETSGLVHRIIYDGTAYPARPAGVPEGYVEYVGPVQPTDWMTGDTWVEEL